MEEISKCRKAANEEGLGCDGGGSERGANQISSQKLSTPIAISAQPLPASWPTLSSKFSSRFSSKFSSWLSSRFSSRFFSRSLPRNPSRRPTVWPQHQQQLLPLPEVAAGCRNSLSLPVPLEGYFHLCFRSAVSCPFRGKFKHFSSDSSHTAPGRDLTHSFKRSGSTGRSEVQFRFRPLMVFRTSPCSLTRSLVVALSN